MIFSTKVSFNLLPSIKAITKSFKLYQSYWDAEGLHLAGKIKGADYFQLAKGQLTDCCLINDCSPQKEQFLRLMQGALNAIHAIHGLSLGSDKSHHQDAVRDVPVDWGMDESTGLTQKAAAQWLTALFRAAYQQIWPHASTAAVLPGQRAV